MFFDNITAAGDAANQWYWSNKNKLSPFVQEKIQALLGPTRSPIEAMTVLPEIIYANKEVMDDEALDLALGLFGISVQYNFYGLADGRGQAIIFALNRELGNAPLAGTEWPEESEDPEVKAEYVQPANPEEVTPEK